MAIKDTIKKDLKIVEEAAEEIVEEVEKALGVEKKMKEGVEDVYELKGKDLEKVAGSQEASADLIKSAEAESIEGTKEAKELAEKRKKLLEKAKKLKEKVSTEILSSEELKEQVKAKKKSDMLIPLEDYVKSGIYLGTKVVTPKMKPFVYRRRADGLAIFNTDLIDEKLKEGVEYLSKFDAKDVVLVCKRPAGWKAVSIFSQLTGIRVFTKKYPAGILTNTDLPNFFENELTIVCDSWLDRNALNDTLNVQKKVLMICDTNNFPSGANQIIIGNNKSPKSLGVIFYLLARGFCKAKNIDVEIPDLDLWMEE